MTRSFVAKITYVFASLLLLGSILAVPASAVPSAAVTRPWEGTLDLSFDPAASVADGEIWAIAVQPDGKIIIGGAFISYRGQPRKGIARLHSDGTLDTSFNPGTGTGTYAVRVLALQPDGKILIGGDFPTYNDVPVQGIARLNPSGSLDASFVPETTSSSSVLVYAIALGNAGKIIIGGEFSDLNGVSRVNVARLNANGSLDPGFNPGQGPDDRVESLVHLPDGKVMIGGWFIHVGSAARSGVARLNANGSLDPGFNPGETLGVGNTSVIVPLADGKLLLGGLYRLPDNTYIGAYRVGANGLPDPTFDLANPPGDTVESLLRDRFGRLLIGGKFAFGWAEGPNRAMVARLSPNGTLDTRFDPGAGADDVIHAMALQRDGRLLIAGRFRDYDGVARNSVARINLYGYWLYLPMTVR